MTEPQLGRIRTRAALAGELPRDQTALPFALVELFGNDLDAYAELISGPGDQVAGFMTRGEGVQFTERVRIAFAELGLGRAAYERYAALSTWFEHLRAFLKIEWHRTPAGLEPLAACYFRRRPPVPTALARLAEFGVGPRPLARAQALAYALDKPTIHFVSAAFRPDHPPHHKLYFSQMADASSRAAAMARVERVFELFGITGPTHERWRELHEATVGFGEPTFFVSTSFVDDEPSPSFKIDYPGVSAVRASEWRPRAERPAIVLEVERACARAGTRALSFLGVRFSPDAPAPTLKYYADVPIAPP
jgi:hypothetical protein